MSKSPIVNVRVEQELHSALNAQAHDQHVSMSELVRVLLREGAGVCDLRESGYREGKLLGYAEARKKLEAAFGEVPMTLDDAENEK